MSAGKAKQDKNNETNEAGDGKEPLAEIPAVFLETLDELANHVTSLFAEMRNPEGSYAARVRDAVAEVRKSAAEETTAAVRKEFDAQFRVAMETVRDQYNTRFLESKRDLEAERDALAKKVEELKQDAKADALKEELQRTAEALTTAETEIAKMVEDPDVELSKIIRHNAMQSELKAYLKGLRYQAEVKAPGSTDAKETA